jgi:pimeloyl-ACP methyl ester carboxylesterase
MKLFPGVEMVRIDLQVAVDVAHASMEDYVRAVMLVASDQPGPVGLVGWSMGGLVALMAAQRREIACVVLLEPSPPGEIQGFNPDVQPLPGAFDPEVAYGRFPTGVRARPESSFARAERKRGISVPRLSCPSLVVAGDDFAEERGRRVAELYGSHYLSFPGLNHWGLVLDPRVPEMIARIISNRAGD